MPRLFVAWALDRDASFGCGFGETVVVGEDRGEFFAEHSGGGQMDGVQGAKKRVGFDHGGAYDVLIHLDVFEGVEQPLGVWDQCAPAPGHGAGDLDAQQVSTDPLVAAVLALEGEERFGVLLDDQELESGAGVDVVDGHRLSAFVFALVEQRAGEWTRVLAGDRTEVCRDVAGVLSAAQASLGFQPGEDRRPLGPFDRNQAGDGGAVLGDLDGLTPPHAGDHVASVVPQFAQPY